ncbi:hypothetical protein EON63_00165 [archaeon]|nr:MAG: hypothetical protein EON63_00165 [archaeon]
MHDVKHHPDDLCDQPEKWPDSYRYNQKIAVGCGDLVKKCVVYCVLCFNVVANNGVGCMVCGI